MEMDSKGLPAKRETYKDLNRLFTLLGARAYREYMREIIESPDFSSCEGAWLVQVDKLVKYLLGSPIEGTPTEVLSFCREHCSRHLLEYLDTKFFCPISELDEKDGTIHFVWSR